MALPEFLYTVRQPTVVNSAPIMERWRVLNEYGNEWVVEDSANNKRQNIPKKYSYTDPKKAMEQFLGVVREQEAFLEKRIQEAHELTGIPMPSKTAKPKQYRSIDD
jgi:hypothetical protein